MPPLRGMWAPGDGVNTGETLVREGGALYFFVIAALPPGPPLPLPTTRAIGTYPGTAPGVSSGGWAYLEGQARSTPPRMVEPGEVLVVPTERVFGPVRPTIRSSDLILRAYLLRRSLLIRKIRMRSSALLFADTARLRDSRRKPIAHDA